MLKHGGLLGVAFCLDVTVPKFTRKKIISFKLFGPLVPDVGLSDYIKIHIF